MYTLNMVGMNWPTDEIQKEREYHPWDEEEAGVCPHCGVKNEPDYTFCRNCIGRLPVEQ